MTTNSTPNRILVINGSVASVRRNRVPAVAVRRPSTPTHFPKPFHGYGHRPPEGST